MAEDTVDNAILIGALPDRKCMTKNLPIYEGDRTLDITSDPLAVYGTEKYQLLDLEEQQPALAELLSETLSLRRFQVVWAVRFEMARTIEDMLQKGKGIVLGCKVRLRIAPQVAEIMAAKELGQGNTRIDAQLQAFYELKEVYLIPGQ